MVLLCFLIDEVAVQRELADDRVNLAKREWSFPFQPMANEPIRVCGDARLQCGSTRIISKSSAMLARQHGAAVADDACAAALESGIPANPYQFVRRWLEHRTPLTLRQVDPIIRQLTLYRDLIDQKTQENQP